MKNIWGGVALSLLLASCAQRYVGPGTDQPQAVLKFRRTYHETPGARLSEELDLDGMRAFEFEGDSADGAVPQTDAIAIFPGFHSIEVRTQFTTVGNTGQTSYQISQGECERVLQLNAQDGAAYLIQLNYESSVVCSLECYKQVPRGNGEFTNQPCQ